MNNVLRSLLISWWVLRGATGSELSTDNGDTSSASKTVAGPATSTSSTTYDSVVRTTDSTGSCPSRTVNYITHTLARQCLRTDRVPYSGAHGTASNETVPTTSTTVSVATAADQGDSQVTPTSAPAGDNVTDHASSIADAPSTSSSDSLPDSDEDGESPLDNANFLSFEEWKRQNLAKIGQSPEDIGKAQQADPNRPRPINNALESMGEEQEIDLDFAGFGGAPPAPAPEQPTAHTEHGVSQSVNSPSLRSKDAGKTCKERTNYASFDCAATVLKTNKECTHSSSILIEHKDSYMLNICSVKNKFFIVELCNDIQIDTIVLANYEFFSSNFRHFKVSVSDRYPVKEEKWKVLGTFEARNTREMQAFLVENPLIWAKYLRIELLTHYGTEYYCPVSLLRVHGTTMMEDYRHQEELARGEIEETEAVTLEAEVVATPPIAQEPIESTDEASKGTVQAIPPVNAVDPSPAATPSSRATNATEGPEAPGDSTVSSTETIMVYSNGSVSMQVGVYEPTNANMTCDTPATSGSQSAGLSASVTDDPRDSPSTTGSTQSSSPSASSVSEDSSSTGSVGHSESSVAAESPASQTGSNHTTTGTTTDAVNATVPVASPANANASVTTGNKTAPATDSTRVVSSVASPPPPQPSTQESFFKSVTKRLLQLENNSTLSLQYIEEQSRILRDAFSKVEKRQMSTTTKFLAQLNETVMVELHGFRQAYDQLWQSTVIELENQRETYQREMLAMSTRLSMVADELVWQKRMGIVQSTLLLLCLALVLFGRQGNAMLDVPIMQHMLNKSRDALRGGWESQSPPNSPTSPTSRSPVSLFRRRIWRSSTEPTPEHQKYISDSDLSRQQTGEDGGILTPSSSQERPAGLGNPELGVVVPPSPRAGTSDWEDFTDRDREGSASPEFDRKGANNGGSGSSSPGRKRKKPKKSPGGGGVSGHLRPKSPLGLNIIA